MLNPLFAQPIVNDVLAGEEDINGAFALFFKCVDGIILIHFSHRQS